MSEIVVFLGPSLGLAEAREHLDARYLPPAAMGDVYRALRHDPRAIVIIDGLFEQTPSVWHKEILLALSRGVRVYGGASMGALRACELDEFGMIGVGSIYERYRDGTFEDDDEVAVSHAPADMGWRPLSDAMVNLRDGLQLARELGVLEVIEADALVAQAKARFYPERSWAQTLADAAELGLDRDRVAALRDFVREHAPNRKRDDARFVLARVAADHRAEDGFSSPRVPSFRLEPAAVMLTLIDETALVPDGLAAETSTRHRSTGRSLGRMIRATAQQRDELYSTCLYRLLLAAEGVRAGVYAHWIDAFEALAVFGDQLDDPARRAQARQATLALERRLRSTFGHRLDVFLPQALADRGELSAASDRLRQSWAKVHAEGLVQPSPEALGCEPAELFRWYAERFGLLDPNPERHASAAGISLAELLLEAGAQYLLEREDPPADYEDPSC